MSYPLDPFRMDRDYTRRETSSEYGFGRGMHPDPGVDFNRPDRTRFETADGEPYPDDQLLLMRAVRRMNTSDPNDAPSPYVQGNPDRYGGQPPLVRERSRPYSPPREHAERPRFRRRG